MTDNTTPGTDLVEAPATKGTISSMAMVPRGDSGGVVLRPQTFSEVIAVAQMMAQASLAVPKHLRGNPGACMAVVLRSANWDMDPFAVATKTYAVGDILAYESQLVSAVVNMRAPVKGRPKIVYEGEGQELRCTFSYVMQDGDVLEYRSPKVKDIPVKNSPLWKGDPEQQLFYYSARAWARRWVPEVLMGVYTPDEVIEQTREGEVRATSFAELEHRAAEETVQDAVVEEIKPTPTPTKNAAEKAPEKAAEAKAAAEAPKSPYPVRTCLKGHADPGEVYLLATDAHNDDGYIAAYVNGAAVDSLYWLQAAKLRTFDRHAPAAKDENPETAVGLVGNSAMGVSDQSETAAEGPQSAADAAAPESEIEPASSASEPSTATAPGTEDTSADTGPAESEATPSTPEEFLAFAKVVADATTWDPIREALPVLKKTEAWAKADPAMCVRIHQMAFTRLTELVHEGYRFDFTEDLHAYRCFLDHETDLPTLKVNRDMVHKTRGWMAMPTEVKVKFDQAYSAAEARIQAAAAYA